MRLMLFVQLLQNILHKTIDEVEEKANELTEDTVEQDEDKLDLAAFDFILKIINDMRTRYLEFKATFKHPDFEERVRTLQAVEEEEEEDEGHGGLH